LHGKVPIHIYARMSNRKICTECLLEKAEENFSWKSIKKGKRQSTCKECHVKRSRSHYRANVDYYKSRSILQKAANLRYIIDVKNRPCADCGSIYPYYVMDFDHRPGTIKLFNIGGCYQRFTRSRIVSEIEKCDVVCSNCHRIRTFERGQMRRRLRVLPRAPIG
jgi:hypothetical protein